MVKLWTKFYIKNKNNKSSKKRILLEWTSTSMSLLIHFVSNVNIIFYITFYVCVFSQFICSNTQMPLFHIHLNAKHNFPWQLMDFRPHEQWTFSLGTSILLLQNAAATLQRRSPALRVYNFAISFRLCTHWHRISTLYSFVFIELFINLHLFLQIYAFTPHPYIHMYDTSQAVFSTTVPFAIYTEIFWVMTVAMLFECWAVELLFSPGCGGSLLSLHTDAHAYVVVRPSLLLLL